jgi:hypothetical protein
MPVHRAPDMATAKVRSDIAPRQRGFGECRGSGSHAPPTPSTRGRGALAAADAVRQHASSPSESAAARRADHVVARRLTSPPDAGQTGAERQFAMDVQKIYDDAMQRAAQEGETRAVVRMIGLKLGRPLTDAERRGVTERWVRLGHEVVERAFLQLGGPALERWLATPPG